MVSFAEEVDNRRSLWRQECPPQVNVLSLVTFFGRSKKATRLPAGTGEFKLLTTGGSKKTKTAGAAPRPPPYFLFIPPKRKYAKKRAAPAGEAFLSRRFSGTGEPLW